MTTPAVGQEEIVPPAPPSLLNEDMKTGHALAGEDALGIEKEPAASTHMQLKAGQEDPASSGREPSLTEGTSGHVGDSGEKFNEAPSNLMLEISSLRDKLRFLEERVGQASDRSVIKQDCQIEDERQLRKQIRRARLAKNWVDEAETLANETRDDRQALGAGGPFLHNIEPSSQISKDGVLGTESTKFQSEQEWDFWHKIPLAPHRGLRPPTSLRPHYSRKLGPPTEWDTSDSDEWSSDASIGTRDFEYFRARLRGDFEWELDRLTAQKRRFEKYKIRKQEKAKRVAEVILDNGQAASDHDDQGDKEQREEEEKFNAPVLKLNLNPVEWGEFRASRKTVATSSFIVDILVEEPKLLGGFLQHYRGKSFKEKAGYKRSKVVQGHQEHKGESTGQGSARMTASDGRAQLPERIRIHSREIIRTLGIIHGSEITPDGTFDTSIVMLRPYRILTYYDVEIRQWHSRLEEQYRKPESAAVVESTPSDKVPPNDAETTDDDEKEDTKSLQDETHGVPDPEGLSKSKTALNHLACLLKFMDDYVQKRLDYLKSPSCEKIFFSDIWHLFKPGDHVICADGKDRWSRFAPEDDNSSDKEVHDDINIQCVFIHFDGNHIGPVLKPFTIPKFDGEKAITSLEIYPLRFHLRKQLDRQIIARKPTEQELHTTISDGVAKLQNTLVERGKLFTEVAAVKHMYYSGLTVNKRDEVQSQVMVDFVEAFQVDNMHYYRPEVRPLIGAIEISTSPSHVSPCQAMCCSNEIVHNDVYVDNKRHHDFMKEMLRGVEDGTDDLPPTTIYPRPLETLKTGGSALARDDLLIMSYSVFGFVLRDRSWANHIAKAELDLTYLTHITDSIDDSSTVNDDETEDDKTAFGRLVLPTGHKKMVLSLISQHFRNKATQRDKERDEQVDIVRGKGKGLIILLHGAPGVGKTTTAEGVAERFKKPLFQITCGDLGSSPKEVEDALQTNFALANRWGCILLLDEADVFLAERRRNDFNRNGLVAVFLRVLEYYAGILFLTTNRIGDFDEAFASRIHMSLHYPPLELVPTSKIFALNLKMIKKRYQETDRKITIDMEAIEEYAGQYWQKNLKARLNGRQIRNACQTALALAEFDAQPEGSKYDLTVRSDATVHLKVENIRTVSEAYLEFIEYLKAVHGTDAETHANETGLRALETAYLAMRSGSGHGGMGSAEGRKNRLHNFKLQTQPSQSQSPMRQDQGSYGQYHRHGPSYDSGQASMGPYNTPPRMGGPQSHMAPYQPTNMPNPNYQQNPDSIPAAQQFQHSGGQQRFSPSQQRPYSPSPSGPTLPYQNIPDATTNPNMVPMRGQSAEPFGRQDLRAGNVWPGSLDGQ
ncbi:aaa family atpase [Fusarium mexicanum]|uniref:Aaa family atpase n=1 Tax=Fusarium mexicanum TaxID=751941 RepID=A0A8H5I3R4_9HYPO|nr:aaa family atpase [Fusarium mexicanum]